MAGAFACSSIGLRADFRQSCAKSFGPKKGFNMKDGFNIEDGCQ